jgi:hypothetical protein
VRIALNGDRRTRLKVFKAYAGASQRTRTFGLKSPSRHLAAGIFDVDQQPGVRVGVLKLLNRTGQRHLAGGVEHGAGMMRQSG